MKTVNRITTGVLFVFFACTSVMAQETLVFPHVAAGAGLISELELVNPHDVRANARVEAFDSSGRPIPFLGILAGQVSVNPFGRRGWRLGAENPTLYTGWVKVTSDIPITGIIKFIIPNAGSAAIANSRLAVAFIVPVRRDDGGLKTGVAIANPLQSGTAAVLNSVQLEVRNAEGSFVEKTTLTLPGNGHIAKFVDQFFTNIAWNPGASWRGTLTVVSSAQVGVTAFDVGPNVGEFTVMPVTPCAVTFGCGNTGLR